VQPQDFAKAAAMLEAGAPQAGVPGMAQPLGPEHARLARLAARCDRLFLARPPLAPGAVICGASHSPCKGVRAHAAGIGPDARSAWVRAMGEVAEGRALQAPRGDRPLPVLDHALRPCGSMAPAAVLQGAAHGLGAGADLAHAARAAWHEAVERHAIAVWLSGDAPARPLRDLAPVRGLESALRGGVGAPPLRFLCLPGAVPGLAVVVALSRVPAGVVPGYGCAPDLAEAACKAAVEVVQGEFALHLEGLACEQSGGAAPADGFSARAQALAARPDLTDPVDGPLAMGAALWPRFADLTLAGDAVPVLRVITEGLRAPLPGAV
jgi:ribosomal protein S12 methylthiotransferase accessory factor YcaO